MISPITKKLTISLYRRRNVVWGARYQCWTIIAMNASQISQSVDHLIFCSYLSHCKVNRIKWSMDWHSQLGQAVLCRNPIIDAIHTIIWGRFSLMVVPLVSPSFILLIRLCFVKSTLLASLSMKSWAVGSEVEISNLINTRLYLQTFLRRHKSTSQSWLIDSWVWAVYRIAVSVDLVEMYDILARNDNSSTMGVKLVHLYQFESYDHSENRS